MPHAVWNLMQNRADKKAVCSVHWLSFVNSSLGFGFWTNLLLAYDINQTPSLARSIMLHVVITFLRNTAPAANLNQLTDFSLEKFGECRSSCSNTAFPTTFSNFPGSWMLHIPTEHQSDRGGELWYSKPRYPRLSRTPRYLKLFISLPY